MRSLGYLKLNTLDISSEPQLCGDTIQFVFASLPVTIRSESTLIADNCSNKVSIYSLPAHQVLTLNKRMRINAVCWLPPALRYDMATSETTRVDSPALRDDCQDQRWSEVQSLCEQLLVSFGTMRCLIHATVGTIGPAPALVLHPSASHTLW